MWYFSLLIWNHLWWKRREVINGIEIKSHARGIEFSKVLLYAREKKNPLMDDVTWTARNEVTFTQPKKKT